MGVVEFIHYLRLVLFQGGGQRGELFLQSGVIGLGGEGFGPIEGEVEVAAAVVQLFHFAGGGFVVIQHFAGGGVEGRRQYLCLIVASALGEVFQRGGEGEELAEGIPTQMVVFQKLLHMFGGRAAGAGFEQAAAVHQRHDGQHLGAGSQFQNGEEVGEIVPQHIAGDGDGVLARLGALQGVAGGIRRRHDLDIKAGGVVLGQILFDLLDEFGIVRALLVEPEHGGGGRLPRPVHRQFHPVLNRRVFRLTHSPYIAGLHLVLQQGVAVRIHHRHGAGGLHLEGFVVGAVFLGLLRHQAHIRHAAHRGRVEGAVLSAEVDNLLIHRRVAAVWNHRLHIVKRAVRPPHLAGGADGGGHGGVDNHIAWHMQVGYAAIRIHHGKARACLIDGGKVSLNLGALIGGQGLDFGVSIADAVVRLHPQFLKQRLMLLEHILIEDGNGVAKDDRVRHLHHRGLQMKRQQHTLGLGIGRLLGKKLPQGLAAHTGRIYHLIRLQSDVRFKHRLSPIGALMHDAHRSGRRNSAGLLTAKEIPAAHRSHMRLGVLRPLPHRMRMLAGIFLHRRRRPPVRVALPQHRIHRTALDAVIPSLYLRTLVAPVAIAALIAPLVIGFLILRQSIPLPLQFLNRRLQLRHRSRDIRQFDDITQRLLGNPPQLPQMVILPLLRREMLRKPGNNPPRQRYIPSLHPHPGGIGKGLDDRQQRPRSKGRRLVRISIDNSGLLL